MEFTMHVLDILVFFDMCIVKFFGNFNSIVCLLASHEFP